jgi:hypothetical protein
LVVFFVASLTATAVSASDMQEHRERHGEHRDFGRGEHRFHNWHEHRHHRLHDHYYGGMYYPDYE